MKIKNLFLVSTLVLISFSARAQQNTIEPKDYAAYPHWQDMMLDHSINFFETQRAFYTYWKDRTPSRGSGYKVFKRWEYKWETLVSPTGEYPEAGQYYDAYTDYKLAHPTAHRLKSDAAVWKELGPKTRQNYGGYVGVGRLNAIAFHPTDPATYYVGSPSGGFWYTYDDGATWGTSTDTLPTLGVSAILVHPENPSIILMGTGDDDGGDDQGLGVFKSTDGGLSWIQSNEGMGNLPGNVFAINEDDPNTVLAGTENTGIYKKIDTHFRL